MQQVSLLSAEVPIPELSEYPMSLWKEREGDLPQAPLEGRENLQAGGGEMIV